MQQFKPILRPRRLRHNPVIRDLVRETELNINDLVHPIFIKTGQNIKNPITSMPGYFQLSVDNLEVEVQEIVNLGIKSVILFGIPECKDELGSDSYSANGIIQQTIKKIKSINNELLVISDICFCEYTSHGHCGVVNEKAGYPDVDNDATLELLVKQAVSHAEAGTDIIAPSGMIDGMVGAIREGLDAHGYNHIPILSYSVKYSSAMYGPFRIAAEGAPKFGDRKTYQMDFANSEEALKEAMMDVEEGADMLMVKPAHTYLDIIYKIKQAYPYMPLAAYHTSGEFAMLKAAIANGWLDEKRSVFEVLTSIKRAGADFIITYFTKEVAAWLKEDCPI
jgi:porphobilinogen synthase